MNGSFAPPPQEPPPDAPDAPPPRGWRGWLRRRRDWLLLTVGLMGAVALGVLTQPLPRIDRMLQDNARAAMSKDASDGIVIVAIDDKTVEAIGRFPWRRAFHAELLRRIGAQAPRCIGLDLLLTEADREHPQDDEILADAMLDVGCAVLPIGLAGQRELLPRPALAHAAAAMGHAHLSVDEDGTARSVYLREGFAGRRWPHFALALHEAAQAKDRGAAPPALWSPLSVAVPADGPWLRSGHEVIVFARGEQPYRTVSYIDVLRGDAPPELFRDRLVLVGTTAAGLGDMYATPAPRREGLVPGVEIFASVLQGLEEGRHVVVARPWQDLLFNLGPLFVALLGLLWLRPLGVIALICAMCALRLGLHVTRPWVGVQFAPAAGFAGLLLIYPLWSLLRLQAAVRYLRWGTEELLRGLDGLRPPRPPAGAGDFLDQQMAATAAAARRMRDLHRFVRDGIGHLPDATMVLDVQGSVVMANRAAEGHWHARGAPLLGADAHRLLADIRVRGSDAAMIPPGRLSESRSPVLGEGEDALGRALLLRCVPFFNAANAHAGWMVALVDITAMRRAQSQRDEALRFISHDMREPSAAILTILELARNRPALLDDPQQRLRIERHARTGLELADGFVNLARAEVTPFRSELLDLVSLVQEAMDSAWAQARRARVQLVLETQEEEALCPGDRGLIARALANLLSNAIKYSPPGERVHCMLERRGEQWMLGIRDHGPGIPVELQSQLFQPFHRLHRDSHPEVHGVGLGLLLVRTVAQRHGGSLEVSSAAQAGCTMMMMLPVGHEVPRAGASNEE